MEEEEQPRLSAGSARSGTLPPLSQDWRAMLVVTGGEQVGRRYVLGESSIIGRSGDVNVRVEDAQVSRRHARLHRDQDGRFVIEDLGSRNGTMVNGSTVERRVLVFGDRVHVGSKTILLFTHRDPAEEQLLQRQKLEAIGRMGAGIAHDFNNLLGAVVSSLDYLGSMDSSETLRNVEVQECLIDIRTASTRAAELTRRLLGFARRSTHAYGAVNISELTAEVIHLVRRAFDRSIKLDTKIGENLMVSGDRAQLHQVFMNLCINARDAMPNGGRLGVTVSQIASANTNNSTTSASHVVITVEDSGMGMDEETKKKAFEPFFTTKQSGDVGSGLGLSTVHDVVTGPGGRVDVQSEKGRGTRFIVYLPMSEVGHAKTRTNTIYNVSQAPAETLVESARILLVDDEEILRRSTARLLKHSGHEVVAIKDGREAVDYYKRANPRPELVLLDMNMPEMSGADTFHELKQINADVRVLFVSGYWNPAQEQALAAEGALGFVEKPYDVSTLTFAVARALRGEAVEGYAATDISERD